MIVGISIEELLNKNKIDIIDIRSIEKYNDNHIEGARNIPMILLLKDPSKYLTFDKIYYVYCQKGINSIKVCNVLNKIGYKTVNIIGGYENWILKSQKKI